MIHFTLHLNLSLWDLAFGLLLAFFAAKLAMHAYRWIQRWRMRRLFRDTP
jgi:hypothetical protein